VLSIDVIMQDISKDYLIIKYSNIFGFDTAHSNLARGYLVLPVNRSSLVSPLTENNSDQRITTEMIKIT